MENYQALAKSFQWFTLLKPEEVYVYHGVLSEPNKDGTGVVTVLLLLSKSHLHKESIENREVLWTEEVRAIHCIEEEEETPEMFRIVTENPVVKNKLRSTKMETFLENQIFFAPSLDNQLEWVIVLRGLLKCIWQPHYETQYMSVPEIYQTHINCTKINLKGRHQIRNLAISTERVYNLQLPEGYPLMPGKQKWSFKIEAIKKLKYESPRTVTFVTSLPKIKSSVSYLFKDEKEALYVYNEIKRLYFSITKTQLATESDAKDASRSLNKRSSKISFKKFYT